MARDQTLPLAPPRGMEDLLPEQAWAQSSLLSRLGKLFARFGYERVITPAVEHAEVLERGLEVDRREVMRFVDPETGEVALLRPDITPQIARIVATRMVDRPPPFRLAYHGTVLRRQRGRARRSRQRVQVGIEHIGTADRAADVEVIDLAIRACREVGLEDFRVELGHVQIARALLDAIEPAQRTRVEDALERKDVAELERLDAGALVPLASMYGDLSMLDRARDELGTGPELDALRAVTDALGERGHGDVLSVDLGELRGHAYYTGVSFTILAAGPGEPIGGGGRYDELLARFGRSMPATGFALDAGTLAWALQHRGTPWDPPRPLRIVALGDARADAWREHAMVASLAGTLETALDFARAWRYDAVLVGATLHRVHDGATRALAQVDLAQGSDLAQAELAATLAWARNEVR